MVIPSFVYPWNRHGQKTAIVLTFFSQKNEIADFISVKAYCIKFDKANPQSYLGFLCNV